MLPGGSWAARCDIARMIDSRGRRICTGWQWLFELWHRAAAFTGPKVQGETVYVGAHEPSPIAVLVTLQHCCIQMPQGLLMFCKARLPGLRCGVVRLL